MNIILAWRNLWRNKRRTLITVASVFFGVLLSTIISSMQEGSYSSMVDNVVKFYSGYIQVQNEEYWDNKTLNNSMEPSQVLLDQVTSVKEVTHVTSRLESFALASSHTITKGAMVSGVVPDKENEITQLKKWVVEGSFFSENDQGVLVGSELAKYLKMGVGDTLVLLGSGYHGVSAAGKFPIRGILNFPNPELNKQSVYMDLKVCQEFFSADNLVSSLIVMVKDQYDMPAVFKKLKAKISAPYAVLSWDEMQPELVQLIDSDRAGGQVMIAVLYILIGFGIFSTIMMLVAERTREMGVMVAIGMQKSKLAITMFLETVYIGIIGVLAGFAGSIPIIIYFYNNPISLQGGAAAAMTEMGIEPYMYFTLQPSVFYRQAIIVFAITSVVALYPLFMSAKLKVNQALKA